MHRLAERSGADAPARRRRLLLPLLLLAIAAALIGVLALRDGDGAEFTGEPAGPGAAATPEGTVAGAPPAGRGRTRFVDPRGSDRGPGSPRKPWQTLGRALRWARAGDTVVLRPGTYGQRGEWIRISRSGSPSAPITITGPRSGGRATVLGAVKVGADHVRLRRLLFDGPTGATLDRSDDNPLGEEVQVAIYGDGVEIAHAEIRNNLWHAGIYLSGAEDARIVSNHIHHNGDFTRPDRAGTDQGVYFGSGSGLVANNIIEGNYSFGVQLYPGAEGVVVTHNTIVRNGRAGIVIGDDASDNRIVNNIVALNGRQAVDGHDLSGDGNLVDNNLIWRNAGTFDDEEGISYAQNLERDPEFVRGGLWRVGRGSPAIDRGARDGSMPVDRQNRRRPQGGAPDIGAYEIG
jgi:parallel beta-helix repeat protein